MGKNSSGYVALILSMLLAIACAVAYQWHSDPWKKKARLETPNRMTALASEPSQLLDWPPKLNKTFPSIALHDHQGNKFEVQALKGKPTLIEIVAMSCAGCQAFSGGNSYGGYGGFPAQAGLKSIDQYVLEYSGGVCLESGEVNFIQIIIYNQKLEPATPSDIAEWRDHFKLHRAPNWYVLTGGRPLANQDSFKMIPGFLLLDKDLVVRYDATGHHPRHNLYTELLPAVRRYL